MKYLKIFAKIVSCVVISSMLFSSSLFATQVVVPNMTAGALEYSVMVQKASVFGDLQAVTVDGFSKECITENKIDKAIEAAQLAASEINKLKFLTLTNAPYTGNPFLAKKDANKDTIDFPQFPLGSNRYPAAVRDNDEVVIINGYLKTASIGAITLVFKTPASDNLNGMIPTDEYFDSAFLRISHDLIGINHDMYVLDFTYTATETEYTLSNLSSTISQYADFLTSLKVFYQATGCYDKKDKTSADNTTSKAKKNNAIKDAVIVADDKTIKVGDSFSFMKGVTAADNGGKGDDLTSKVRVSGKINTGKPGIYKITYSVLGANGNVMYNDIEVTVEK